MCEICGIYFPGRDGLTLAEKVQQMTESLRHRGPDGAGLFTGNGVALGHRRCQAGIVEGLRYPCLQQNLDL